VGKDPEEVPDADPKFEKVKELQEQWQVKPGQIWQVGEGRLMCGSAMEEAQVDQLLDGELIDLIVTSPPYNQKLNKMKADDKQIGSKNFIHKMSVAYFDALPEEEYQAQQIQLCNMLLKKCKPLASFFYNHKIRYRDRVILSPMEWLKSIQWNIRQEIIWSRKCATTISDGMFMLTDERIYWLSQKDFYFDNQPEIKSWSTVWEIAPRPECDYASAPYPNELPKRCILACSKPGELVFDPYMGSGTTLIVADGLKRKCYGMEINPAYCAVILDRFAEATGKKPYLIE
jgi:modification methylase